MAKPWWNLPRILLAAQNGRKPDTAKLRGNQWGGSTRICPREPWRVRKQFYPETFTMAEDPKAIAVGEKYSKKKKTDLCQKNLILKKCMFATSCRHPLKDLVKRCPYLLQAFKIKQIRAKMTLLGLKVPMVGVKNWREKVGVFWGGYPTVYIRTLMKAQKMCSGNFIWNDLFFWGVSLTSIFF